MRRILLVILLLTPAGTVRAEINVVDSLEWKTVQAPLVVRGKVVQCKDFQDRVENRPYRDVTVAIAEKLKGPHAEKTVTLRLLAGPDDPRGNDWKKTGHEFLFFLTRENRDQLKGLEGQWQLQREPIDLDALRPEYSARMRAVTRPNEVLDIVRKYAAKGTPGDGRGTDPTKRAPSPLLVNVPSEAEIFNALWAGSSVLMKIPADEEHRQRVVVLVHSTNPWERAKGARQLRAYPGRETVKLLEGLLKDEATQVWTNQEGKPVNVVYAVRQAAYESLLELGEKPAKPLLSRQPTPEEVRKAREQGGNKQN
jgi:hypothetical protein